ncbi:MAG: hypothetical protein R3F65_33805, partial [bacterium]
MSEADDIDGTEPAPRVAPPRRDEADTRPGTGRPPPRRAEVPPDDEPDTALTPDPGLARSLEEPPGLARSLEEP